MFLFNFIMNLKNILRLFFISLVFLAYSYRTFATDPKLDSLLKVAENSKGKQKGNAYYDLSHTYRSIDIDQSIHYAKKSLAIAQAIEERQLECSALTMLSIGYQIKGEYSKAVDVLKKGLKIAEKYGFPRNILYFNSYLGNIFYFSEKYDMSLVHYAEVDKQIISQSLEDSANYQQLYWSNLSNMGGIYAIRNEFDKAIPLYLRLYDILRKQPIENQNDLIVNVLNNLGHIYQKEGDFEKALSYLDLAIEHVTAQENSATLINIYGNKGEMLMKQGETDKALNNLNLSLEVAQSTNSFREEIYAHSRLVTFYEEIKEFEQGLLHYKQYHSLKDSLLNKELLDKISNIEVEYETKQKEQEILMQEQTIFRQKLFIGVCLFAISIIIVLGLLMYRQYKDKSIAYKKLVNRQLEIVKEQDSKKLLNKEASKPEERANLPDTETIGAQSNQPLEKHTEKYEELMELMNQEKPYLDGSLTLESLSKLLNTNRTYLSQAIKANTENTFSEFINSYRIDEARRMLLDDKFSNLSIEGIALSVGFNSRSTFNKVFKEFTGITPSYFRDSATINV